MDKKPKKPLKKMVAPPRKSAGDRVRAVRDDKGNHHKWSDGRENTSAYKRNKREGVNWSDVRCKGATCWTTKTRRTDKTGVGAYKQNKDEGHYVKQLRRKVRYTPQTLSGGVEKPTKKLKRKMKYSTPRYDSNASGRWRIPNVPLPMSQQSKAVQKSWGYTSQKDYWG
tara:strand:- start:1703 stop:2206 length:504 start_codon:yes stop_codon:yes gene_type:complete